MLLLSFLIFSLIIIFYFYVKYKQSYWKRHGVYQFETVFLFGSRRKEVTGQESMGEAILRRYNILKKAKQKHGGSYQFLEPIYMPIDPEILKLIMLKDFSHFMDRGKYHQPSDVISMNLFNLEGEEWKNLRAKLTPTFTSGKMKMMFGTLLEKAVNLENVVEKIVAKQEPCDIKNVLARFTTDVIGSCAFGLECNSLEDPGTPFRKYGEMFFKKEMFRFFLMNVIPWKLLSAINLYSQNPAVNEFFTKVVQDTIKYRETSNISRNDFMQLLIEMKNGKSDFSLTENQIIAQSFSFFAAGFETSSSASTFTLYALAQHQDIQDKLRKEILEVIKKNDGKISYDAIMEMKYLDKVLDESLRLYPVVTVFPRICNKAYKVPGTDLILKKGTRIEIPVWGLHKDPEYYPNPEEFNPENFNEENKAKRPDFTFLPFGDGPRICIGSRFAKLQSKVALVSLLRKYKFTLKGNTNSLKLAPGTSILKFTGIVYFEISSVEN